MAVKLVPARKPDPPIDVARYTRQRVADAVVRALPHGSELHIVVDGDLRWSKIVRGDVCAIAREHWQSVLVRGWRHPTHRAYPSASVA